MGCAFVTVVAAADWSVISSVRALLHATSSGTAIAVGLSLRRSMAARQQAICPSVDVESACRAPPHATRASSVIHVAACNVQRGYCGYSKSLSRGVSGARTVGGRTAGAEAGVLGV